MCYQYLFTYTECGCRKALWERVPCRFSGLCDSLVKRDVPIDIMCASCRKVRDKQRKIWKERLLEIGRVDREIEGESHKVVGEEALEQGGGAVDSRFG